ncbi:hypothetical protein BaRGS_00001515 [Batillaria attramentaria]|uniref:Uncharacterized protein n=1 Tax=Batillaria attramentaria TaxID=370345 RepID=A0ABD0M783_9CAEN
MSIDSKTLIAASEKVAAFFERTVDENGQLKTRDIIDDVASVYKLPTLLLTTGRWQLCHKVLDDIKARFLQPDGDFISWPEKAGLGRKSASPRLQLFWPYLNTWVAMASHRLGRFDISVPAMRYLATFFNPNVGGFGTSGPFDKASNGAKYDVGIFMSAHLGLAFLYFGDMDKAVATGDLMGRFVEKQKNLDKYFLLRVRGDTGELIEELPAEDLAVYYRVDRFKPRQLYFMLGYPVFFLYYLAQATGDQKYIKTAEAILDYLLTCDESFFSFSYSHKCAYGASLIALATGKAKYREMSARVAQYLVSLQTEEGTFDLGMPLIGTLDQSAEIGTWLKEIGLAFARADGK